MLDPEEYTGEEMPCRFCQSIKPHLIEECLEAEVERLRNVIRRACGQLVKEGR